MLLLLSGIGIAITAIAIRLAIALKQNFKTGNAFRANLSRKIEQLRFGKMLNKRDIDLNKFIYTVRITDIESNMRNCQSCSKTSVCDRVLAKQNFEDENFGFCPNTKIIEQASSV